MDIVKLNARKRSGSGKSYTRKARVQGWIPAIYYGRKREAENIEINANDFIQLVRAKKTRNLINLGLSEESGDTVAIIKEIQRDTINRKVFLHIDFQRVAMDEKVTVGVPVELTGLPPIGVKEMGGVLQHPAKIIRVECLPANIPEKISVDVSMLKIGDSVHIRDISVQNGVIKDSPDEVVAVVIQPTAEEVKAPEVEEGAEAVEGAVPVEGAEGAAPAEGAAEGAPAKEGVAGKEGAVAKPGAAAKPGVAGKAAPGAKPGAPAKPGAEAKPAKDAKPGKGGKDK